jgi:anti-anti-sigma factor
VALLVIEPDLWSVMLVERKTQTAGGRARPVTGWGTRGGFLAPPQLFSVAVHLEADRAVVTLRGELDLMNVAALVDCIAGITPAVNEIVLDFAGLDFIDCSGLRAIVAATQTVVAHGGLLSICSPRPQSQRLFDLVNFEQIVASHL